MPLTEQVRKKNIRPARTNRETAFKEYPNAEIRWVESQQWWTGLNRQPLECGGVCWTKVQESECAGPRGFC